MHTYYTNGPYCNWNEYQIRKTSNRWHGGNVSESHETGLHSVKRRSEIFELSVYEMKVGIIVTECRAATIHNEILTKIIQKEQ